MVVVTILRLPTTWPAPGVAGICSCSRGSAVLNTYLALAYLAPDLFLVLLSAALCFPPLGRRLVRRAFRSFSAPCPVSPALPGLLRRKPRCFRWGSGCVWLGPGRLWLGSGRLVASGRRASLGWLRGRVARLAGPGLWSVPGEAVALTRACHPCPVSCLGVSLLARLWPRHAPPALAKASPHEERRGQEFERGLGRLAGGDPAKEYLLAASSDLARPLKLLNK